MLFIIIVIRCYLIIVKKLLNIRANIISFVSISFTRSPISSLLFSKKKINDTYHEKNHHNSLLFLIENYLFIASPLRIWECRISRQTTVVTWASSSFYGTSRADWRAWCQAFSIPVSSVRHWWSQRLCCQLPR